MTHRHVKELEVLGCCALYQVDLVWHEQFPLIQGLLPLSVMDLLLNKPE